MFKSRKVVMVPTKDTSAPIGIDDSSRNLFRFEVGEAVWGYQHLYVISDEDIEQGDWFLYDDRNHISDNNGEPRWVLRKCDHIRNGWIFYDEEESEGCNPDWSKKIIATTAKNLSPYIKSESDFNELGSLKYYHLPKVSEGFIDKFIEYYNLNRTITDIEVEYENSKIKTGQYSYLDIEQLKIDSKGIITIKRSKDKWSKEDVEKLLLDFSVEVYNLGKRTQGYYMTGVGTPPETLESFRGNWIKENL